MITASIVALWFVQAPPAPPVAPPVREWDLGGAFTLKQEFFFDWQAVIDPGRPERGLHFQLRPTQSLELAPARTWASRLSLAVESAPALAAGAGVVRPKLQLRVAGESLRVGVMQTTYAFRSSSGPTGAPVGPIFGRPMAFVSGRF